MVQSESHLFSRAARKAYHLLPVTEDADDGVTVNADGFRAGFGRIRVRDRRGDGVVVTLTA